MPRLWRVPSSQFSAAGEVGQWPGHGGGSARPRRTTSASTARRIGTTWIGGARSRAALVGGRAVRRRGGASISESGVAVEKARRDRAGLSDEEGRPRAAKTFVNTRPRRNLCAARRCAASGCDLPQARVFDQGVVPDGALFLTAFVDVQEGSAGKIENKGLGAGWLLVVRGRRRNQQATLYNLRSGTLCTR